MVERIMLYKLSLEKVRKKTITDAMFRVDDDVGKDCLTIVCRGKEVALCRGKESVRLPLQEVITLLDMLEKHYDCVKDAVTLYQETNRDTIN